VSEELSRKRNKVKLDSLDELIELAKVDFTDLSIGYGDNISLNYSFQVSPETYLKYAKSDLKVGGGKSLINSLSNAKRSIDCLVESVLKSLNIDPNKIPENGMKFCDLILNDNEKNIKPKSLKLFCALGLAPSILISEVRTLRNKVEHEYVIPELTDVVKATEVAELLLNNVKTKEVYSSCIDITDVKSQLKVDSEYGGGITGLYFNEIYPKKDERVCEFALEFYNDDWNSYYFTGDELVYFFFLRAMFIAEHDEDNLKETIALLLNYVNIKTPKEHVKITQVHR